MTDIIDTVPKGHTWDALAKRLAIIAELSRMRGELLGILREGRSELRRKQRTTKLAHRKLQRLKSRMKGQLSDLA